MNIYFVTLYATSLLLGYILALNGATLTIGRSISNTNTYRGFQNAITPPWSTNLALFSFTVSACVVGYGWYEYGWLFGVGITVGFVFIVAVNKVVLLPKSDSEHFRRIIVHSMLNRYANFVKSGDELKASAMGALLEKLGIPFIYTS